MATMLYPNVGALKLASTVQTLLAASKLKLFSSAIALGPGTKQSDLAAHESAFSGYAAKAVAAWQNPYLAGTGGANISSGYQQWDWVAPVPPALPVAENVLGWWLEDAAGDLIAAGLFDNPIPMGNVGDSLPLTVTANFGRVA